LKGEFITHISKGDSVTVLDQINLGKHAADEPAQWAKIALPANVKVWVRASFIDESNKVVLPKKLNLRAGPGENYSVLGVIERGTPVSEVITKDDWMQIEAPTNAYAFVAAMYLKQEASGNMATNTTPSSETETPMTTNSVSEPETIVTEGTNYTVTAVEGTNYTTTVTETSDTNAAAAEVDTNLPPPPPRVVTHEGVVRHVGSIIAPTTYELYDPRTGDDVDFLYSTATNLDLSRYNGLRIVVTGEEGLAERWKDTPVLTIQRIQVVEP
jgi:SH3-like domain-containing protein